MDFENPIRAVKDVIEADERQLPSEVVVRTQQILGLVLPPIMPFSRSLDSYLNKRRQQNRELLLDTVAIELEKLLDWQFSEEHKRWNSEEFPGLLIEAANSAEQIRSRARIVRLAKVIRNAVELGPSQPADIADEMLRVAAELSDEEINVLVLMHKAQSDSLRHRSGRPDLNEANSTWATLEKESSFFREGAEVYSICAKLQSLGLVLAMERNPSVLGLQSVPYVLLPKGAQFIRYVQDEAKA